MALALPAELTAKMIFIINPLSSSRNLFIMQAFNEAIALAETLQPHVILMDVRMPLCDGVQATREIH